MNDEKNANGSRKWKVMSKIYLELWRYGTHFNLASYKSSQGLDANATRGFIHVVMWVAVPDCSRLGLCVPPLI